MTAAAQANTAVVPEELHVLEIYVFLVFYFMFFLCVFFKINVSSSLLLQY